MLLQGNGDTVDKKTVWYEINTIAGNGTHGYSGDGGPAIDATFPYNSRGLATDSSGNLYIAAGNYIRKIDSEGIVTQVTSRAFNSYCRENMPASDIYVGQPYGLATDSAGNLYVSNQYCSRVVKIDTNGYLTTVAGNGNPGYSGDEGPARDAGLTHPTGLAVDSFGNLFIADAYTHTVRRVDAAGYISTDIDLVPQFRDNQKLFIFLFTTVESLL